jgi:diphosphomevalonate decarboxylase
VKATAIANSNIALVKYWGKRNTDLILPHNSSVSMTLDSLFTTTTVEFSDSYQDHQLVINGQNVKGEEYDRVVDHLDLIQRELPKQSYARIISKSNFPKKAGLASSASGFAALTSAVAKALNLDFSLEELSILARRGSGSASRSILGGFVQWNKGTLPDGSDSLAIQVKDENHWPELSMIVTIISMEEKKVSSRAGMSQTVKTSPLYKAWLDTIESDVENIKEAIINKDFTQLGRIAEANALKMHSTMHTTDPPIIYWQSGTLSIMKEVIALREKGTECYFTMDAGPQVKILCLKKDLEQVKRKVLAVQAVKDIMICHSGEGIRFTDNHLF